jgi:outer membrane protein TolC
MNALAKRTVTVLLAFLLSGVRVSAQNGSAAPPATGATAPTVYGLETSSQNPLTGSITVGKPSGEILQLSMADAIHRGLRQNLGLQLAGDSQTAARGVLWQERSDLLPNLSGRVSENAEQVNLAAEGFGKIVSQFPGFPLIVGPFGFFDVRATLTQSLINMNDLDSTRSAGQSSAAAKLSYQDAREMVVLVVGATYLSTVASAARVDSAQAQLQTAQALYDQAVDLKKNGVSAGIDLLRAQVELQTRQQQLIATRNSYAKQKLSLARTIGLPLGQEFTLTDKGREDAPVPVTVDDALQRAYAARADYQSALARVRSDEYSRSAATAEHLPSLSIYADYGAIGPTLSQLHGSYTAYAALQIPIFAGNRAKGDALVADAALQRDRQQLENLRAQIEQEVRATLLDLQSSFDQVGVARSNVDLAQQTLVQARDRFNAGATDNIEVVQAQESVANANESYISSLYAYNLAQVELARATGSAERSIPQDGKGK